MTPRDRLARLHCVNTLFHRLTGHDLYLASQVLEAIDAAEAGQPSANGGATQSAALTKKLHELHEALLGGSPDAGFAFCDGAAEDAAGPLWLRAELLSAVRRNAPYREATIMVGNIDRDDGAASTRRRRSRSGARRATEHAETVAQLRDLAARRTNPRSLVTLLFV